MTRALRPVEAVVDLGAVSHNIARIRESCRPGITMLVPVKANAYGHGIVPVARHLQALGVDGLATANVDEALAARAAGVTLPILLYGACGPAGLAEVVANGLMPTVTDLAGIDALAAAARTRPATAEPIGVHLKVDAGMGRLGVRLDEAVGVAIQVAATPGLALEGMYTHIPFSDEEGGHWSRRRLDAFVTAVAGAEAALGTRIRFAQAAASAVMTQGFADSLNTVSPGHLTFGLHPIDGADATVDGFRRALQSLRAEIIHLGTTRGEDDVLGGRPADRTTAVILLGVDNGYRHVPGAAGAHMLCNGVRCPVLGVSAEYTVLDVTAVPSARVGDAVTVVGSDGGHHITAEDVARQLGAPSAASWLLGLKSIPMRYVGG